MNTNLFFHSEAEAAEH